MKNKILLLAGIFICFGFVHTSAQSFRNKIVIKGTVVDVDKIPIPDAIIVIDGQKTNVETKDNGKFKVRVKRGAERIGIVTFGNGIILEDIAGRTDIDFTFNNKVVYKPDDPKVAKGDELVNTGYSKIRKKNLTNSVSNISDENTDRYSSIYDMLQRVPGVYVTGQTVIVHRTSNNNGDVPPLFLVDGIPVSEIDDILPRQVESISVLKGNAAAIYGARGFGGVILITRKAFTE